MKIPTVKELAEAGLHFGHREGRWHPTMKPFIYGSQKNVHIIDLDKTKDQLKIALDYITDQASKSKKMLLVGTKIRVGEIVKAVGEKYKLNYVDQKWLGGALTNFKTISKNIERLKQLEEDIKTGKYKHYTKRERHEKKIEIDELNQLYGGIKDMKKLPDVVIVLDAKMDSLAVKEANRLSIPVVALTDTNIDISEIAYPIPGNDDALKAVELISSLIGQAYEAGVEQKSKEKAKKEKKAKKDKKDKKEK